MRQLPRLAVVAAVLVGGYLLLKAYRDKHGLPPLDLGDAAFGAGVGVLVGAVAAI
jgi:hypothetical protein